MFVSFLYYDYFLKSPMLIWTSKLMWVSLYGLHTNAQIIKVPFLTSAQQNDSEQRIKETPRPQ
jgi:hypothetical protein